MADTNRGMEGVLCDHCQTRPAEWFGPDPFIAEICEDDPDVMNPDTYWCEDCFMERKDEI